MSKIYSIILSLFILVPFSLFSQDIDSEASGSNSASKLKKGGWNAQFQYRFLLSGNMSDTVALNALRSGSVLFGIGGDIKIAKNLNLRFQPGFTFSKLYFEQNAQKTFPTNGDSTYSYEKLRTAYLELPIGFRFNMARDDENKITLSFEIGASIGILAGSAYKFKLVENDKTSFLKVKKVDGVELLRYGAHAKLNYKSIGIVAYYRLSNFFSPGNKYSTSSGLPQNDANGINKYPAVSPLELGLVLGF